MGGDRTNAERQRRYIAWLKAQAAKAGVRNAADDALVQELTRHIRDLETENAEIRDKSALEQAAARLQQAMANLRELEARFVEAIEAEQAKIGANAEAEIAALKAQLARKRKRQPVTKPVDPNSEVARLKVTITELRARLNHFKTREGGKVDTRTFTIMHSRMHPDRVSDPKKKARYKIAFDVFGKLKNLMVDKAQLPLTREEWDARRKKPQTKKRQPAVPPRPPRHLPKG